MADARKTVQLKSCPTGHLYLGQECPCEHADRDRARFRQALSEDSPGSARNQTSSEGPVPPLADVLDAPPRRASPELVDAMLATAR